MRVIDIARKAGVSSETVRYYARLGLLNPTRDEHSTYKMFDNSDYARLLFIRDARALGMPITDVETIINASRHSRVSHPQVMALLQHRLDAVQQEIKALKPVEQRLMQVLRTWQQLPHGAPSGRTIATVINAWPEKSK